MVEEITHAVVVHQSNYFHHEFVLFEGSEAQCVDARDKFNQDSAERADGNTAYVVRITR